MSLRRAYTRNQFITLSHKYVKNDESVLPYPELSPEGKVLHLMSKYLKKNKLAVAIAPKFEHSHKYMLQNFGSRVFNTRAAEFSACLMCENPFDFWRQNLAQQELPATFSLVINPGIPLVDQYSPSIFGAFIGNGMENSLVVKHLAALGLTRAKSVREGFWLSLDST